LQPGQPSYGDLKATLRRLSVIYGPERSFFFLSDHHYDMFLPTYQISEPTLLPTYRDSIGLQANAQVSWFLQRHLDYFIVTRQISFTYRDLVPFRQFIVTSDLSPIYQDVQKPRHRDADGNSLNRRAVGGNVSHIPKKNVV